MNAALGNDPLARAKQYPYYAPPYSYLFVNGTDYEIAGFDEDPILAGAIYVGREMKPVGAVFKDLGVAGAADMADRVPVIAHGSNAAPSQLARKFAALYEQDEQDVVIPVMRARLVDHDVVYAPHFSGYGAMPATLDVSPGTTAEIAVTYLTPDQLAVMHETEISAANYVYGHLDKLILEIDGLEIINSAFVYLTLYGSVMLDDAPTALSAVKARRRRFASASLPAMLARARDHTAPGISLDDVIMENIENEPLRRERSAALRSFARRPEFAAFEVLEG
jgi:hypothetical protein